MRTIICQDCILRFIKLRILGLGMASSTGATVPRVGPEAATSTDDTIQNFSEARDPVEGP